MVLNPPYHPQNNVGNIWKTGINTLLMFSAETCALNHVNIMEMDS